MLRNRSLQGVIDALDRGGATSKAFHDAVTAQGAALAKGNALLKALKMLVQNQLGSSQQVLGDFGFQIPTRKTPTKETKAAWWRLFSIRVRLGARALAPYCRLPPAAITIAASRTRGSGSAAATRAASARAPAASTEAIASNAACRTSA